VTLGDEVVVSTYKRYKINPEDNTIMEENDEASARRIPMLQIRKKLLQKHEELGVIRNGVCVSCRRVSAPTVDTLMMDISPRVNRINLMTGNFLTMFDVPYTIQVFAENGIGEGAGSNTIVFTRIPSEYIAVYTW